jgi:hypothetical protein
MDIDLKYIEIAKEIIDSLSESEIEKIIEDFELESILIFEGTKHENLKDFLYEDYAYVLPPLKFLLSKKGISEIVVVDYCDNCDDDKELTYFLNSGRRICTECGFEISKYEI